MTFRVRLSRGKAASIAFLLVSAAAFSQVSEQITYSFTGQSGSDPRTNLVFGPSGKVYGMTTNGGINGNPDCGKGGCGVVFQLTPKTAGNWGYQALYPFNGGTDGLAPYGDIVFDAAGNLYGTTSAGGTYNQGTVFELTPSSGGQWTETILHSFSGTDINGDGAVPRAGLIQDAKGNLYGTTYSGGSTNNGAVFELSLNKGSWSESIIYSFLGGNSDGAAPSAEVAFDTVGNLYGTTSDGGSKLMGIVFELTPTAGGGWDESVLYNFPGENLAASRAPVWLDSSGVVYGTTCGQFPNQGTVFELAKSGGVWKEKTLHTFGKSGDGSCPISGLTPDSKGNLYGTATLGGASGDGIVYEMVKGSAGSWSEKTIYNFAGGSDGVSPWAGVTVKGTTLYGTTTLGGSANFGAVYKITQ